MARDRLVGYDISPETYAPQVLCPDCGSADDGPALRAGEEWGAWAPPACKRCGVEIEGLELVDPL